jgi:hypothetical protein
MESRQKYIEVDIPYEIDENFVDAVMELTPRERLHVLRQIRSVEYLDMMIDGNLILQ